MFKRFDDLRIANKLLVVLTIVLAFTVVVGGLAIVQLDRVNAGTQALATNALPRVRLVSTLRSRVLEMRAVQYAHMLSDSEDEQKQLKARIHEQAQSLDAARKSYEPLVASARERAAYDAFTKQWAAYLEGNERVLSLTGDFGTKAMDGDYRKLFDAMNASLNAILALNDQGVDVQVRDAEATASQTRWVICAGVAAAVAIGSLLAWLMASRIARSLEQASTNARAVAKGDLTGEIPAGGRDEVGRLLDALKDMQSGLRALVNTVRLGIDSVATASSEIASGNSDLSVRTEQQAASLQVTVSAVQQMADNVRQNTNSATQADALARAASATASRGGEAVMDVVRTMDEIKGASSKIVDIIGVIDGIAFQTNILALNAAVEAARAGEQGRGFAVVAGEVRSLAQRSASAAKEIKSLIADSVERVEEGSRIVRNAGETMDQIVHSVGQVSTIIAEISNAAGSQASGIDQINVAVTQLDNMTQQNAALVEQSAAAAQSLQHQGETLRAAVARFHIA